MFAVGGARTAAAIWSAQSLPVPAAERAGSAEVIDPATATTANCPGITGGSGQNPQAAGRLPLPLRDQQADLPSEARPSPGVALTRLGFAIEGKAEAAGDFYVPGQWAVTAP